MNKILLYTIISSLTLPTVMPIKAGFWDSVGSWFSSKQSQTTAVVATAAAALVAYVGYTYVQKKRSFDKLRTSEEKKQTEAKKQAASTIAHRITAFQRTQQKSFFQTMRERGRYSTITRRFANEQMVFNQEQEAKRRENHEEIKKKMAANEQAIQRLSSELAQCKRELAHCPTIADYRDVSACVNDLVDKVVENAVPRRAPIVLVNQDQADFKRSVEQKRRAESPVSKYPTRPVSPGHDEVEIKKIIDEVQPLIAPLKHSWNQATADAIRVKLHDGKSRLCDLQKIYSRVLDRCVGTPENFCATIKQSIAANFKNTELADLNTSVYKQYGIVQDQPCQMIKSKLLEIQENLPHDRTLRQAIYLFDNEMAREEYDAFLQGDTALKQLFKADEKRAQEAQAKYEATQKNLLVIANALHDIDTCDKKIASMIQAGSKLMHALPAQATRDDIQAIVYYFYALAENKKQSFEQGTFFIESDALYNYLRSYPTVYERLSSHVPGKVDKHYGIDIAGLPGDKSTIVFGKINGTQLFYLKPEDHGCPSPFEAETMQEALDSSYAFAAHAWSFVRAKTQAMIDPSHNDRPEWRKEYVPYSVTQSWNNLIAVSDLDAKQRDDYIKSGSQKYGWLSWMMARVGNLKASADAHEAFDQAKLSFNRAVATHIQQDNLDHMDIRKGREVILTQEELLKA